MAKQLLIESFPFRPTTKPTLVESASGASKILRATGVFQNYLNENANGRIYPKSLWDKVLTEGSPFMTRLKERSVLGVLEHPADGNTRIREVSHVITEVWYATPDEIASSGGKIVEGDILGTYETLPVGDGAYLCGLLEANVGFGISSRGQGNVRNEGSRRIVEDDFDLDTWDVVYNPSVKSARPRPVTTESTPAPAKSKKLTEGDAQPGYDTPVETEDDLIDALEVVGGFTQGEQGSWVSPKGVTVKVIGDGTYAVSSETDNSRPFTSPSEVWQFLMNNNGEILEGMNPALMFKRRHRKDKKSPAPVSETQTPPNTTMSKLEEMRQVKSAIIRLTSTQTKGLKPSDKAALLDEASSHRRQLDSIVESDKSLVTESARLQKRLQEFEDVIDAPDAPPPPPADTAPPADPNAAPVEVDSPLPPEAVDVINRASEMLRSIGGEDEEAAQVADELDALATTDGGEVGGDEDPETDFVDDIPVAESKTKATAFVKRYRTLEAIHKATLVSAGRLLERVRADRKKAMRESANGGAKQLQEYKTAATELAEMYNRDMIATSLSLLEATNPEAFAAHGEKFKGIKVYKKLQEAFKAANCSLTPKAPAAPVAESDATTGGEKSPITEGAPTKPKAPIAENVQHPSVAFVLASRRKA